jgi:hypothetical protein
MTTTSSDDTFFSKIRNFFYKHGKNEIFPFIVQLLAVFIALTTFFFVYVVGVEKEEVGIQLGIVSKSLLAKNEEGINNILTYQRPKGGREKNVTTLLESDPRFSKYKTDMDKMLDIGNADNRLVAIISSLDAMKISSIRSLRPQSVKINEVNTKIYDRSKTLVIFAIITIISLMILFKLGYSYDEKDIRVWGTLKFPVIDNVLLVVICILVIVVTEFLFLNIISKHYVAVDPNLVGRKLNEIFE